MKNLMYKLKVIFKMKYKKNLTIANIEIKHQTVTKKKLLKPM